MVWSASSQTVPIRDNFNTGGALYSIEGRNKWVTSPGADPGEYWGIEGTDDFITAEDSTYTNGSVTAYWDSTITDANGAIVGFTLARKEDVPVLKGFDLFIGPDSNYWEADGYMARFREFDTGEDWMYLFYCINGAYTLLSSTSVTEIAVNDTLLFYWYKGGGRKTAMVRHVGGAIDSLTTTDQTYDSPNMKFMFRGMEAMGAGEGFDNFMLAAGPEIVLPTVDTVSATLRNYSKSPSSWSTATTGSITFRAEDVFALDTMSIQWRPSGGTWGDSLLIKAGASRTDTTIAHVFSAKTVGDYEWRVYASDSAGNAATYSPTQYLTVSDAVVGSGVKVVFAPALAGLGHKVTDPWTLAPPWGNGTVVHASKINWSLFDYYVHFFNANGMISTTPGEEWIPEATTPGAAPYGFPSGGTLGEQYDYYLEWGTYNNPGSEGPSNLRQMMADSAEANGVRVLLDIEDLFTAPDIMEVIMNDSTMTESMVDSLWAYAQLRGYTGFVLDFEWPSQALTAAGFDRWARKVRAKLNTLNPPGILGMWGSPYLPYAGWTNMYPATFTDNFDFVAPMTYAYGLMDPGLGGLTQISRDAISASRPGWNLALDGGSENPAFGVMSWMYKLVADSSVMAMTFTGETREVRADAGMPGPLFAGYDLPGDQGIGYWGDNGRIRNGTHQRADNIAVGNPSGVHWDNDMKMTWATDATADLYVSYETPQSIRAKMEWGLARWPIEWIVVWEPERMLKYNYYGSSTADSLKYDELWVAMSEYRGGGEPPDTLLGPTTLVLPVEAAAIAPGVEPLVWNTKVGATAYAISIQYQLNGSGKLLPFLFTSVADTFFNLNPDIMNRLDLYTWRVAPINSAGTGEYSLSRTFTTLGVTITGPPKVPVLLTPAYNATGIVTPVNFTWNNSTVVDSMQDDWDFEIRPGDTTTSAVLQQYQILDTFYLHTQYLNWSTVYYWRVRGGNTLGDGVWSPYFKFTTNDTTITPPPAASTLFMIRTPDGRKGYRELNSVPVAAVNPNSTLTPLSGRGSIILSSLDGKWYGVNQNRVFTELSGSTTSSDLLTQSNTWTGPQTFSANNTFAGTQTFNTIRTGYLGYPGEAVSFRGTAFVGSGALGANFTGSKWSDLWVTNINGAAYTPGGGLDPADGSPDTLADKVQVTADTMIIAAGTTLRFMRSDGEWMDFDYYAGVNGKFELHGSGNDYGGGISLWDYNSGASLLIAGDQGGGYFQGRLQHNGLLVQPAQSIKNLGAGDTTFIVTKNFSTINGDGLGNTIATITGTTLPGVFTFMFNDALVDITDDAGHTANTVDLNGAFTSADNMILQLVFDGTSWYEISRSAN